MGYCKTTVFYEDEKCVVERDKWNFIVIPKPLLPPKRRMEQATYINNPKNLLWELCDCRHFFKRESKQAIGILRELGLQGSQGL